MPAGPARLSPLPTIIPAEIVPAEALRLASRTLISTTCITAPLRPTPDSMNVPHELLPGLT
jgi:hypothetical protein